MQKQKYISILVASAGILMPVFSANAQMLMPSLHAQMERQSKVDAQYAQDKIRMHNEQRSAELRQEAAERIQKLEKKSEPTLDPIARDAALSRRVVKITEPTPQSSIKNNPRENITLNAAPTSRSTGNIDMNQVEQEWLSWVNNLRQENNLHTLTSDARLSHTAQEWSEFSKNRWFIIHWRPGDGCVGATNYSCYNFQAIDNWFKDRGVNPQIIGRSKHTENLGIGGFRCSSSDCTQAAIKSIRKTYNFFLSEKSYNGVHYRTMLSPTFTKMGLGLAHNNKTYYLTIHYTNNF